jgi:hypothetical protein
MIPCSTLPANESIAPAVTASAPVKPWRWKKRMNTVIRASADGTPVRVREIVSDLAEVDLRNESQHRDRREGQQRGLERGPPRDPPQRRERRLLGQEITRQG